MKTIDLDDFLDSLQYDILFADARAKEACKRSKYSVQDFYMCLEFHLSRVFNRMAKNHGSSRRAEIGKFRNKLNEFKKKIITEDTIELIELQQPEQCPFCHHTICSCNLEAVNYEPISHIKEEEK